MPRPLTPALEAARTVQQGKAHAWLFEINYSGGVLRVTDASVDLVWNSETWVALGGVIGWGSPIPETEDTQAQIVQLTLSGVDGSIPGLVATNEFRGRIVRGYMATLDIVTGQLEDADPFFLGYGNGDIETQISYPNDASQGEKTVTVTMGVTSELRSLDRRLPVQTNQHNYRAALDRMTHPDKATEKFFEFVSDAQAQKGYWGEKRVAESTLGEAREFGEMV